MGCEGDEVQGYLCSSRIKPVRVKKRGMREQKILRRQLFLRVYVFWFNLLQQLETGCDLGVYGGEKERKKKLGFIQRWLFERQLRVFFFLLGMGDGLINIYFVWLVFF